MVIELAGELRIPFGVRDLQTFDAINADEALLASTPFCLMPVTKINGITLSGGGPGPIYKRLIEAWSARIGFDVASQIIEGARRRVEPKSG
jgi:branched-chain amino acid aminotransferase